MINSTEGVGGLDWDDVTSPDVGIKPSYAEHESDAKYESGRVTLYHVLSCDEPKHVRWW